MDTKVNMDYRLLVDFCKVDIDIIQIVGYSIDILIFEGGGNA